MNFENSIIKEVILFQPRIFKDKRGYFFESFNQRIFKEITKASYNFVQDNQSYSKKNTLRGLHYQIAPHQQGKLVRVLRGEVLDVAVDLRKNAPTYGKWVSYILSEENRRQLWIPPGFAHGFYALSDAIMCYKTTGEYHPAYARILKWNDKSLDINWLLQGNENDLLISDSDRNQGINFAEL